VSVLGGTTLAVVLLAGAMIGLAILLAMLPGLIGFRRRRRGSAAAVSDGDADADAPPVPDATRLVRAARSALAEFDAAADGPPSDAVIAAWLRLERAADAGGTRRLPHQTSTEFTSVVLAEHGTDRDALDLLRRLYQRARFGPPHAVTVGDAEAARSAIAGIARSLPVADA